MPANRPSTPRILIAVAALVAVGWVAWVKGAPRLAERLVERELGLPIDVGTVSIHLSPPRIELASVRVRLDRDSAPIVESPSVAIGWSDGEVVMTEPVWTLPHAATSVPSVLEKELAIERIRFGAGSIEVTDPSAGVPFTSKIPAVRITGLTLRPGGSDGRIEIGGREVEHEGGRARNVVARFDAPNGSERLRVDADLSGWEIEPWGDLLGRELHGRASGHVEILWAAGGPGRLRGDLEIAPLTARPVGWFAGVDVERASFEGLSLDPASRTLRIGKLALDGGRIEIGGPADEPTRREEQKPWSAHVGDASLRDVALRQVGTAQWPPLDVRTLSVQDFEWPGPPGRLRGELVGTGGGSVHLDGRTRGPEEKASFEAGVRLERLALPGWLRPFSSRLEIEQGWLSGSLDLGVGAGAMLSGKLEVGDLTVDTVGPPEERPPLRLDRLALDVAAFDLLDYRLRLHSAEIDGVSLQIRRDERGIHPFVDLVQEEDASALAARSSLGDTTATIPNGPRAALPPSPQRIEARITDGELTYDDRTYARGTPLELTDLTISLDGEGGPPWGLVQGRLSVSLGDGRVLASGRFLDPDLSFEGTVEDLPLVDLNGVIGPLVGLEAGSGEMTGFVGLEIFPQPVLDLVLNLEHASLASPPDDDRLADVVGLGLPAARALQLLGDREGRIAFDVSIPGDPEEWGFAFDSGLAAALRDRVPKQVVRPLFVGVEWTGRELTESLAVPLLEYAPGTATPEPAALDVLDRVAVALRWDPGLVASIQGVDGPERSDEDRELARSRAARAEQWLVAQRRIDRRRVSVLPPARDAAGGVRVVLRPATAGGDEP